MNNHTVDAVVFMKFADFTKEKLYAASVSNNHVMFKNIYPSPTFS
jgi:hypothetical protein